MSEEDKRKDFEEFEFIKNEILTNLFEDVEEDDTKIYNCSKVRQEYIRMCTDYYDDPQKILICPNYIAENRHMLMTINKGFRMLNKMNFMLNHANKKDDDRCKYYNFGLSIIDNNCEDIYLYCKCCKPYKKYVFPKAMAIRTFSSSCCADPQ